MLLVYSENISERLEFTLIFLFKDKGISFDITSNRIEFENFVGAKLNYSKNVFSFNCLSIIPHGLLSEIEIREDLDIQYSKHLNNVKIDGINDILSIVFFTISRYEEYWKYTPDIHGRFSAKNSLLFRQNFIDTPIIDYLNQQLVELINFANESNIKIDSRFKYIPTFDIDSTWAYLNKGFFRTKAAILLDFLGGKKTKSKRFYRKQVLEGKLSDPFNQYDFINDISKKYHFTPIYFWLLGDSSTFDRNINWKNKQQSIKINECLKHSSIGIHPSYMSNYDMIQLKREVNRLKIILDKSIRKSRQHFLKLDLPNSYNNLEKVGIKEDYTMGFADHYGFRAGTSFSFYFFDLESNESKSLRIFPITYMDGTLNQYMNLTIDESKKVIEKLMHHVKTVNGNFISLWHNETISETGIWKGWKDVFIYNLKIA